MRRNQKRRARRARRAALITLGRAYDLGGGIRRVTDALLGFGEDVAESVRTYCLRGWTEEQHRAIEACVSLGVLPDRCAVVMPPTHDVRVWRGVPKPRRGQRPGAQQLPPHVALARARDETRMARAPKS